MKKKSTKKKYKSFILVAVIIAVLVLSSSFFLKQFITMKSKNSYCTFQDTVQRNKPTNEQDDQRADNEGEEKIWYVPERRQYFSYSNACSPDKTKRPCHTARDRRFIFFQQ